MGECGQASDGKPTHVPFPRHARKARNSSLTVSLGPAPHPSEKGSSSGRGGRGMASQRGVVLVPFPETRAQETGTGRQRARDPNGGAWLAATFARSRSSRSCAVCDDARRHLHPPSLLQVGGGGGVARRGSVFLAVTLIRCCVGTCTESGWAFTSPVPVHFCWKSCGVPPRPAAQLLSPRRN